ATLEQKIATGFNRNHMHNGEGGRIAEETRVENVVDRTDTTATVWLGLTLGCARCHDHKFDPFMQKEYYQLFAYFNNTSEAGGMRGGQIPRVIDFTTAADKARLADLQKRVQEVGAEVFQKEKELFPRPDNKSAGESEKAAQLSGNVLAELKRPPDQRGS